MWNNWVTIHRSYGLPRIAHEFRRKLELHGITARLRGQKKGPLYMYDLQVPSKQKENATALLAQFKQNLQ